jgi:hypothetical protein
LLSPLVLVGNFGGLSGRRQPFAAKSALYGFLIDALLTERAKLCVCQNRVMVDDWA